MSRYAVRLSLAVLLSAAVLTPLAPAAAADAGLFVADDAATRAAQTREVRPAEVRRKRIVSLDPGVLAGHVAPPGVDRAGDRKARAEALDPQLDLGLFADAAGSFRRRGIAEVVDGGVIWTGDRTDGIGQATLVVRDGRITGQVELDGRVYRIEPTRDGKQAISEIDVGRLPRDIHVPGPGQRHRHRSAAPEEERGKGGTATTIAIVGGYTARAAAASNDIVADIALGVSLANTGFANGGTLITFNLVGTVKAPTDYDETTRTYEAVLSDLRGGAALASLRSTRDSLGGDLLTLIREGGSYCGIAYVLDNPVSSDAGWAVSVVTRTCIAGYTLAHETGHNMGLYHDRYVEPAAPKTEYNFGYVDTTGKFRDIMSYADACTAAGVTCTRINQFSTPKKTYNGRPTGVAAGKKGAADGSRALNENRAVISGFR